MKPLPMPIRVAAGLVATALEEAQELPRKLTELPVTAVSRALQTSMRLQQRVTELAIKGDRALGALRAVPETPTWARFDEDEEPPTGNGLPTEPPRVTPVRIVRDTEPTEREPSERTEPEPSERKERKEPEPVKPERAEPPPTAEAAEQIAEPAPPGVAGPPSVPEYEHWSLPQLRGRFRGLSLEQLEELLAWETAHLDRPAYVTMLSNRIASVGGR